MELTKAIEQYVDAMISGDVDAATSAWYECTQAAESIRLALYALENVTFFSGPEDTPAKVEGTYSDAVDCDMAIIALRKVVAQNE